MEKGFDVMNDTLVFGRNISVGFLDVATMKMTRLENINDSHYIFKRLQMPFDFFYHGKILIIPDPIAVARPNWNKIVNVCNQEIECRGKFICFFHFEEKGAINYVTSLTLPEYKHIKNGLEIRKK